MNRVHEQCPKIDSGTVLRQTGSKRAECTKCTAHGPVARPGRAQAAQPAMPLALPAPVRPTRLPTERAPRVSLRPRTRLLPAPAPPCCSYRAPRTPAAPRACLRALCRVPEPLRASVAVSWLGLALYRNTVQPCLALMSQYSPVYCDIAFLQPSLLQYNPCQVCLLLQYNKLYCNTVSSTVRLLKSQYNCCIAIQIHNLLSCFLQYNFNITIQIFFFFHNTIGQ